MDASLLKLFSLENLLISHLYLLFLSLAEENNSRANKRFLCLTVSQLLKKTSWMMSKLILCLLKIRFLFSFKIDL